MVNAEQSLTIFFTLLAALVLTLLPMPEWATWMRPVWTLLVLIYWTMTLPYRVNVGTAWIVGILLDVLNGTALGEHAFAFTLVIFIVSRMHSRLCMFPMLQQSLVVCFLVLLYLAIFYCVRGFMGDLPINRLYWCPALTSMLLWPWVFSVMRGCRRRFKVT